MHSSTLRGSDFTVLLNGICCQHAHFFKGFSNTRRLGLLAPTGIEGVGAVSLVMAYVTAFYDTYRAEGEHFYAYPDYFSFQSCTPLASYSLFDVWPDHKNVYVPDDPSIRLNAINDRGINILILPDKNPTEHAYHPAQLESARRNIDTCYAYDFSGQVASADLTMQSQDQSLFEWAQSVFETATLNQDLTIQKQKVDWEAQQTTAPFLSQSFRTISLDEALTLL